jgi:mono/diheme cytochrome c family protein
LTLRTVILIVNGAALVAFLLMAALAARRQVPKPPANFQPYYEDDVLEGPRLSKVLGWALIFSAVLAASLPLYWLLEPTRQEKMDRDFLADSIERGEELFSTPGTLDRNTEVLELDCARCHSAKGEGGATQFFLQPLEPGEVPRNVSWTVPSLDDVLLRFSPEEVKQIITYGRPGTPMPAWGLAGGGPLPTQPIDDLVNFLTSIQIKPEKARERYTERARELMAKGIKEGEALFMVSCARCHTKGYSYGEAKISGGGGAFGPNLRDGVELRQFPTLAEGLEKHIEFVTVGSDFQKQYGTQGIGSGRMPGFGDLLTPEQIRLIVEYERSL